MIFVFNKDGTRLMPCHPAKARILLKKKQAKIVKFFPFTIKLNYQIDNPKLQDVTIGIDPGKTIGISITTNKRVLLEAQLEQRTDIPKLLEKRKNARHNRRFRLRYRPSRWHNRKRIYNKQVDGWIPPSIQASLLTYINIVKFFNKYIHIDKVRYEYNTFDIQKLKINEIKTEIEINKNDIGINTDIDTNIDKNEIFNQKQKDSMKIYQKKLLYHKENAKSYARKRDKYTCQRCKKSLDILKKDNIKLQVHHIKPKSQGGTDVPENLVTLCEHCHKQVHEYLKKNKIVKFKIKEYKEDTKLNILKDRIYKELIKLGYTVEKVYGYETKLIREQYKLEKDHHIDARVIANGKMKRSNHDNKVYLMKKIRNHNRKIYKDKIYKGNKKQKNQCPYITHNFRRYDSVKYKGQVYYINSLRSNGGFQLKQLNNDKKLDRRYRHITLLQKRSKYIIY